MKNAIKNFSEQFSYNPKIENKEKLSKYKFYIVAGMGGSHLAADLLKIWDPNFPLIIHRDYGLPKISKDLLKDSLIIASSYSGNTEEVIDVYEKAKENNISLAAVSVGGKLIEMAKKDEIPYIQMPNTGIQPRSALGFNIKALFALLEQDKALNEISKLSDILKTEDLEEEGKKIAEYIKDCVPVIYSSEVNGSIAYNWKIKFNETGKIPAFCNTFPELNHNEMTGFDIQEKTKELAKKFCFIMLYDKDDNAKTQKRMDVLKKLYEDRNLKIIKSELKGKNIFHKIFSSLVLADFAAYYTAKIYNTEPEAVPMVEEFKKLIA